MDGRGGGRTKEREDREGKEVVGLEYITDEKMKEREREIDVDESEPLKSERQDSPRERARS